VSLSEFVRLEIEKAGAKNPFNPMQKAVNYHVYLTSERLVAIAYDQWEGNVKAFEGGKFLWDHTKGKNTKDLTLDEKLPLNEKNFAIQNCNILKVTHKKKGWLIGFGQLIVEEEGGRKTQFALDVVREHEQRINNAFKEIYGEKFVSI